MAAHRLTLQSDDAATKIGRRSVFALLGRSAPMLRRRFPEGEVG